MPEPSRSGRSFMSRFTGRLRSGPSDKSSVAAQEPSQTVSIKTASNDSLPTTDDPHSAWLEWDPSPTRMNFSARPPAASQVEVPITETPAEVLKGYVPLIKDILSKVPTPFINAIKDDIQMEKTLQREANPNDSTQVGIRLNLEWPFENYLFIKVVSCASRQSHTVGFDERIKAELLTADLDLEQTLPFQIKGWDYLEISLKSVTKGTSPFRTIKLFVVTSRKKI
jgi:hypothetical protein